MVLLSSPSSAAPGSDSHEFVENLCLSLASNKQWSRARRTSVTDSREGRIQPSEERRREAETPKVWLYRYKLLRARIDGEMEEARGPWNTVIGEPPEWFDHELMEIHGPLLSEPAGADALVREIGRLRGALSLVENADFEGEAEAIARVTLASTPPEIARLFPFAPAGADTPGENTAERAGGATDRVTDLEELAWGLIANANEGNWDAARPDWKAAAIRWREAYHAKLRAAPADQRIEGEAVWVLLENEYPGIYTRHAPKATDKGDWVPAVLLVSRHPAEPEEPKP